MIRDVHKDRIISAMNVKFLGDNCFCSKNGGVWSFYDQKKNMLSTGWKSVEAYRINNVVLCIAIDEKDGYHLLKVGDKEINEVVEEAILIEKADTFFFIKNKNGKAMLYNPVKEAFVRDDITVDDAKKLIISSKNGKFGVRHFNGRVLVAEEFDKIEFLEGGNCFLVTNADKKGIYDLRGNEMLSPSYEMPFISSVDTPWKIIKNMKAGVYSQIEGRIVVPSIYEKVYIYDDCIVVARVEDKGKRKWGVYSLGGKLIVPVEFSSIKIYSDYIKVAKRNNKNESEYGLFAIDGELILRCRYKQITIEEEKVLNYIR